MASLHNQYEISQQSVYDHERKLVQYLNECVWLALANLCYFVYVNAVMQCWLANGWPVSSEALQPSPCLWINNVSQPM